MNVKNEQSVVVVFIEGCQKYGYQIIDIGIGFPDALILYKGVILRAEFEYKAHNFVLHDHDINECDMIICWDNDWLDCPISVLELSSGWEKRELSLLDKLIAENNYLKEKIKSLQKKTFRKEREVKSYYICGQC